MFMSNVVIVFLVICRNAHPSLAFTKLQVTVLAILKYSNLLYVIFKNKITHLP